MDEAYLHRLIDAKCVALPGSGASPLIWRENGLRLIDAFTSQISSGLGPLGDIVRVWQDELVYSCEYDAVFGSYNNVVRFPVRDNIFAREMVALADGMVGNVAALVDLPEGTPQIALYVGGLTRTLEKGARPLFRERRIFPAFQLNQIVPKNDAFSSMLLYQGVLEQVFRAVGVPVVSVRTSAPNGYGRDCVVSVARLPSGRPTILSTNYVMAREYCEALGVAGTVIDVGMTGKIFALISMRSWDKFGIQWPPSIAPIQCGVVSEDASAPVSLRGDLVQANIRSVSEIGGSRNSTWRARRRLLRLGVPLIASIIDAKIVQVARRDGDILWIGPIDEAAVVISNLLDELHRQVETDTSFSSSGELGPFIRILCEQCSDSYEVFGEVVPLQRGACTECGQDALARFIAPAGRFY